MFPPRRFEWLDLKPDMNYQWLVPERPNLRIPKRLHIPSTTVSYSDEGRVSFLLLVGQ